MTEETYLQPASFIDSDSEAIKEYANEAIGDATTDLDKALKLYYKIRDGIHYTPYLDFGKQGVYRASTVLEQGWGFCASKASLLAACGRAVGIPSRIGFADVENHLNTPRLRELNGGDLMQWHAFTEFYLKGKWVKATPAFNKKLCDKFRVKPLEFNGLEDSIFHPYDEDERKHMEYVKDRGSFADVPYEEIIATYKKNSPKLLDNGLSGGQSGDFGDDAQTE
ncbi:MAG: transglutaminase-like domain-containing protein [Rhodospirillales bacterium]|nr:transglutaminase-like domain-containing protein [Rhodospirillales bacterium]